MTANCDYGGLLEFLDGWMMPMDDDLPDGAWQAMVQEGVAAYNETYGTHIDTFDGWMAWVKARQEGK